MNTLEQTIELGPREEADRLWNGALEARQDAEGNLIALFECLDLGIRAAEILGTSYRTLQRRVRELDLEGYPRYRD